MVDSNNGNASGNKGNNADGNKGNGNDPVGKLSDGLLRLVEEDDGKGNVSYSVETVNGDELVYSSISKAQAFSFCEGYRAANGEGASKPHKPKENSHNGDNGDNGDKGGKSDTPPAIDPNTVKRKRMVF
jgi:hypothetical protein